MLISEEIKPVSLAVIEFCLSEGISQSVGQSIENSSFFFEKLELVSYICPSNA